MRQTTKNYSLKDKKKNKSYEYLMKNKNSYLFIAPFMIIFSTFTVLPVLVSIVLSFTTYSVLELPKWVGWNNYIRLFVQDDIFISNALPNTFKYAIVTGPIGLLLSFFAAWSINEVPKKMKAFLTFIFYAPSISGTIFYIFHVIFGADIYGYANSFLLRYGFVTEPIRWFTTEQYIMPLIIIVQLWMSLGVGFLAMRAGFASIDYQYYEASAIDGIKNRWQELWYITIPMMSQHLMTATVLQVTAMFRNDYVAIALTGFPSTNYAGHMVMTHLQDYSNIRLERGYASAIAVLLFLVMVSINSFALKMLRKVGK